MLVSSERTLRKSGSSRLMWLLLNGKSRDAKPASRTMPKKAPKPTAKRTASLSSRQSRSLSDPVALPNDPVQPALRRLAEPGETVAGALRNTRLASNLVTPGVRRRPLLMSFSSHDLKALRASWGGHSPAVSPLPLPNVLFQSTDEEIVHGEDVLNDGVPPRLMLRPRLMFVSDRNLVLVELEEYSRIMLQLEKPVELAGQEEHEKTMDSSHSSPALLTDFEEAPLFDSVLESGEGELLCDSKPMVPASPMQDAGETETEASEVEDAGEETKSLAEAGRAAAWNPLAVLLRLFLPFLQEGRALVERLQKLHVEEAGSDYDYGVSVRLVGHLLWVGVEHQLERSVDSIWT